MVDPARPAAPVRGTHSQRLAWGIPDIILAILMLPFGLAMLLIERIVWVVTAGFRTK